IVKLPSTSHAGDAPATLPTQEDAQRCQRDRTVGSEAPMTSLNGETAPSPPQDTEDAQRWDRTAGRDGLMASLTGTGALVWLILRRDWILLALFIALPVLIVASQTTALQELYPTAEARQTFTQQSNTNPATLGMLGPIFAPSLGSLVAWRVGVMGMIFAGIPS